MSSVFKISFPAKLIPSPFPTKKCCKVKKVVLPNNTFGYEYNIKENCNNTYNSNIRNIFENEIINNKPFTLDNCNSSSKLFGSCRKIGFECVDFITPEDCNKYKLQWSKDTCHSIFTQKI